MKTVLRGGYHVTGGGEARSATGRRTSRDLCPVFNIGENFIGVLPWSS